MQVDFPFELGQAVWRKSNTKVNGPVVKLEVTEKGQMVTFQKETGRQQCLLVSEMTDEEPVVEEV